MVDEAEKYKAEDEAAAARITSKNTLESYAFTLRNSLTNEKLTDGPVGGVPGGAGGFPGSGFPASVPLAASLVQPCRGGGSQRGGGQLDFLVCITFWIFTWHLCLNHIILRVRQLFPFAM